MRTGLTRRQVPGLLMAAGAAALMPWRQAWAQDVPLELPDDPEATPTRIETGVNSSEHITAPVHVQDQGPFRFLVDTGANASCISQSLAARLNLPAGPSTTVNTAAGRKVRSCVIIERLQVGERTRRRVRAPVLPISGMEVDGVLGVDWLKGQRLVLGLADRSLEVTASRRETSQPGKVVVPARRKWGQLTIVDADLSGDPISAMLDTGSQVTVGNSPLRERLKRAGGFPTPRQTIKLVSIVGEVSLGEVAYIPFMRLGGVQLGNVPVVFTDMHVFNLWDLNRAPAVVLGMDMLGQFDTVALDFGRSKVRFDISGPEAAAPA